VLIFILTLFTINSYSNDIFVSKSLNWNPDKKEYLTLADAVDQSINLNFQEKERKYTKEILEIDYKNKHDAFWYPKISFEVNADPYSIFRLKNGDVNPNGITKTPNGSLGINLGDYTLFNWGKDYLIYQNDKDIFKRDTVILSEKQRQLKHLVILRYYQLAQKLKISKYYKFMVQQSSFVYRFNKERAIANKIQKLEYFQAKSLYLSAQENYHQARQELKAASFELAKLIIDKSDKILTPLNDIQFFPIAYNIEHLQEIAEANNENILNTKLNIKTTKREYQKEVRNNLPLPKITLNLGAYKHHFAANSSRTHYQTGPSQSSVDLVATINASWTIMGENGLFNKRTLRKSHLNHIVEKTKLKNFRHSIKTSVKKFFNDLKYLSRLIKISKTKLKTNKNQYDIIFNQYTKKQTTFINYQDALVSYINEQVNMTNYLISYISTKISIASAIGTVNLPNENFIKNTIELKE